MGCTPSDLPRVCVDVIAREAVPEVGEERGLMQVVQPRHVLHALLGELAALFPGEFLHLGVLLPGFANRDSCTMTANCSQLQLVGEISQLDGPLGGIDASNSTAGPFGPFARDVNLVHPVDVTTPVKSQMGLGILELSFQKGYPNS